MRAIVAGAGPGGAAAALALAQAGADVQLFERQPWPRPKTCGDGVSPLGIVEGRALGLAFEGPCRLERAVVSTPGGIAFRGGWPAATPWGTTIERHAFDASIVAAAIAAGVDFVPATAVRSLAIDTGGVVATVRSGGVERSVRADHVIVADGATGGLATALGFPAHRSRLVALRGYTDVPQGLVAEYGLFYDRPLAPGYGWIFPLDAHRANVGICIDERTLARNGGDVRALLDRWMTESPFARERLGPAPVLEGVRGGIIPSGRRRHSMPRALLIGDAAGVADPFTAEGIFQAISSGRLAARALCENGDPAQAAKRYERDVRIFERNERAARALRATFNVAIGPYARRAASRPAFADRLNTNAFFLKRSFAGFIWDLTRAW